MSTATLPLTRELDQRTSDGIDVRLLWCPPLDRAIVRVEDAKTGESFIIEVAEGESARDVFLHPYAYAAWRGSPALAPAPA